MGKLRLNLALQGGGAHGAFTWGVLDRLLAEPEIEISAISGTSAGALNAAALKAGLIRGGREGARENLTWFWARVGALTDEVWTDWLAALAPSAPAMAATLGYSPFWLAFDATTRIFSPYIYGPALRNPLERILRELRFDQICETTLGPELFVCATNVRTGKIRLFTGTEIGVEVLLASACLPTLFQAVEIHDPRTGRVEAYWDGGYTGNPALFPLFEPHLPDDILIVNINPIERAAIPQDSQSIANRINEISFNSSLLRELRAIRFVQRLLESGALTRGTMKNVLIHMISDDALMNQLNVATKSLPLPVVLARLKAAGEAAAETFIERDLCKIGRESSLDLEAMFA